MDKNLEKRIQEFKKENPTGIILIYGPTGCGKTALSLDVAHMTDGEIVSVDARQIYCGLDIWTGKILPGEMRGIPHHMLDVRNPDETFSVAEYQREASTILEDIQSRSKTPVLCGWTGLYIDSLIYERGYMGEKPDFTRRDELERYRLEHGNEALWKLLYNIDPTYADMLHVNNYTYIIRGIEVFEKTGKSKLEASHWQKLRYPTLFLTPYTDSIENRAQLYANINLRVQKMFDYWLIEEIWYYTNTLLWGDLERASSCPGLVTIGYREVIQYLQWQLSLPDCISLVQQHNRNYAKRQITWNKKYDN